MKRILFFIIFLLSWNFLYSHPHLFIKPSIELLISESIVKGVKISWNWDKWWSQDVMSNCDSNRDNAFNEKETLSVYKDYFSGIKEFDYFTKIFINGKKCKIVKTEKFTVKVNKDKTLTYTFIIPLEVKFDKDLKFSIAFNDETIYTAFDKSINLSPADGYFYKAIKPSNDGYYGTKVDFTVSKNK